MVDAKEQTQKNTNNLAELLMELASKNNKDLSLYIKDGKLELKVFTQELFEESIIDEIAYNQIKNLM